MSNFDRSTINTTLPEGSVWEVEDGEGFDQTLDGIADSLEAPREFLENLAYVGTPAKTTFLPELEEEYGLLPNSTLTETQRRQRLSPLVYSRNTGGTISALQSALDMAGFNLQVHANDPAVDPAIFLDQAFQMVAGGANAYAGRSDAFAGRIGGELLVNGDIYETTRVYTSVAGNLYAGNGGAGEYTDLERTKIEYPIPELEEDWPFVFFVGGDAARDGDGYLTDIESGEVPAAQEDELKRLILKIKPLHAWAGLIITYT